MRIEAHKSYLSQTMSNTPMTCTKYGLKSEQALMGHIEAQCVCPAAATKSQGAHACYSSYVPCAIIQQFLHRYIISWGTMYIVGIATAGGHTMY